MGKLALNQKLINRTSILSAPVGGQGPTDGTLISLFSCSPEKVNCLLFIEINPDSETKLQKKHIDSTD